MKIRSVFLRIILAVLLLVSQQAAMAHAFTHLVAPTHSSTTHNDELPSEQACHQCLAYLSMGSALASSANNLPENLADHATLIADQFERFFPASARHFDSRAPPASLS